MDWIGSDIARDRVINVSFEVNTRGMEIWIERARKQIEHRRNTDEMKNEKEKKGVRDRTRDLADRASRIAKQESRYISHVVS